MTYSLFQFSKQKKNIFFNILSFYDWIYICIASRKTRIMDTYLFWYKSFINTFLEVSACEVHLLYTSHYHSALEVCTYRTRQFVGFVCLNGTTKLLFLNIFIMFITYIFVLKICLVYIFIFLLCA